MIPRWALKFFSRFGYHSQQETINTIDKFLEDEIPVDAVIIDLYWFGKELKGTMGNLEFYKDSFPDPKKMIDDLTKKGVKTILITEPFVLTTSSKWAEAVEKDILGKTKEGKPYAYDFYFGNTGIIDIFKSEGKAWFWNVYKNLPIMALPAGGVIWVSQKCIRQIYSMQPARPMKFIIFMGITGRNSF